MEDKEKKISCKINRLQRRRYLLQKKCKIKNNSIFANKIWEAEEEIERLSKSRRMIKS